MKNKNLSIIFDLDGTLWNSTGCASDIWNRVLEKHNDISFRMTKEKAAQLMGKTMEDIGKILFPEFSAEILHSCKMHESTTHVNGFCFRLDIFRWKIFRSYVSRTHRVCKPKPVFIRKKENTL